MLLSVLVNWKLMLFIVTSVIVYLLQESFLKLWSVCYRHYQIIMFRYHWNHTGHSWVGIFDLLWHLMANVCKLIRICGYWNGHYNDVTMSAIASQITSLTIVYPTVYSDAVQRKHQSSASLVFVRRLHRGPVNSPHKGPVTWKMFPFDDVIMDKWCLGLHCHLISWMLAWWYRGSILTVTYERFLVPGP